MPTLLAAPGCLGGLTYTFVVGNSGIAERDQRRGARPAARRADLRQLQHGRRLHLRRRCGQRRDLLAAGTIPAESIRNIAFLLVAPRTVGDITNTVTVDPNNAIYEADETNNTFVQATGVSTGIDLVIQKDDEPTVERSAS